jgi:hypothetical protein
MHSPSALCKELVNMPGEVFLSSLSLIIFTRTGPPVQP